MEPVARQICILDQASMVAFVVVYRLFDSSGATDRIFFCSTSYSSLEEAEELQDFKDETGLEGDETLEIWQDM